MFITVSMASVSMTAERSGSWASTPGCAYASPQVITASLASLDAARTARDPEAAAAHYSPDAIVMDVGETAIRLGQAEIVAHYAGAAASAATETLTQTVEVSCGLAAVSGTQRYRWSEPPSTAIVRYSILFGIFRDRWLIIHHHADALALEERAPAIAANPMFAPLSSEKPALATGSLTTGSIDTPRLPDIEVPPAAFRLPLHPPVFFSQDRPELLSAPRSNASLSLAARTSLKVPDLPIEAPNASLPLALRPRAPIANAVRVPELPFTAHSVPMTSELWADKTATVASSTTPDAVVTAVVVPAVIVTVPPLSFETGAFPLTPRPPRAEPPARTPTVASFSKRVEPAQKPVIAPKRAPRAARPTPSLNTAKTPADQAKYRPGRWVNDSPVFED